MTKPGFRPSPPENDPHPSTEEIGREERPDTPRGVESRHKRELEEESRVNNGVHDGEKFLKR